MFRTRTPLSRFRRISTARLACVRPPASVHPEPGSNSPLYVCFLKLRLNLKLTLWFSLLGCYFIFNDLLFFSLPPKSLLSVFQICECKDKTFPDLQNFLKFFQSSLLTLLCLNSSFINHFAWAKLINFINMTKSFSKNFNRFFVSIISCSPNNSHCLGLQK